MMTNEERGRLLERHNSSSDLPAARQLPSLDADGHRRSDGDPAWLKPKDRQERETLI
jgi:hypothetical protein